MATSRISDAPRRYGDVSRFRLHYFLAEDAVEVIAVDKRSDDSAPKLLGKRKLLLPEYQHSVNTPTTKTNTYHWTDLASDSASHVGAFTSIRLVSIRRGRGWSLCRV